MNDFALDMHRLFLLVWQSFVTITAYHVIGCAHGKP